MKIADNASLEVNTYAGCEIPPLHRAYPRCLPRSSEVTPGHGLTDWGVHQKCSVANRWQKERGTPHVSRF